MTFLDAQSAHDWLDALALLLLATSLGSVLVKRLGTAIRLLAGQGVLLAAAALVVALSTGTAHAYLAVAITVAAKVVVVPAILLHALKEVRIKREVDAVIPQKLVVLLAIALVMVAYYASGTVSGLDGFLTHNALPAALSMLLIGLLTMLTRKKALSQVVGLVAMENGLYLLAVAATNGLPLAVELGAGIDLAVGVLVMGFFARLIHRTFDTINTDHLRTLRG